MSKKSRPLLSLRGDPNAPTTEPIAQPPAEPNAPIQEKIMPAAEEQTAQVAAASSVEPAQELIGPTAKEMATAEEQNAARVKAIIAKQQEEAEAAQTAEVSIIGLAAQGREALLEGLRQHQQRAKPPEYIPPPRTGRQMSQLEAELAAGRRTQQRAAAQAAARPVPPKDVSEGFTTPVYRPNDMVPDPIKGGMGPIST